MPNAINQFIERNFTAIALVLFLLFGGAIMIFRGPILIDDSYEYLQQAENILRGYLAYSGDLSQPIDPYLFSKRTPAYPAFIVLSGGMWLGPASTVVFQHFLLLAAVFIVRKILTDRSSFHAGGFLLLLATSVSLFVYANAIMSESLLIFALAVMALQVHYYLQKPKIKYVFWFNIALCLALFTKPVFFPFIAVNTIFWLLWNPRHAVFAAIPLILVSAYVLRNHAVTNALHFSSIQQICLADYNLKYYHTATHNYAYADSVNATIHSELEEVDPFPEELRVTSQIVRRELEGNYFKYAWFHLKGALRGLVDPGNFDVRILLDGDDSLGFLKTINEQGIGGVWQALKAAPLAHLLLLGISGVNKLLLLIGTMVFAFSKRPPWTWKFFLLGTIAYVMLLTGPINASRFMLAVWPMMMIASVSALYFYKPIDIKRN